MIYIKKEKLEEIIKHQNEIIEDLQNELDSANSRDCDLAMRIAKAIEYIKNNTKYFDSEYVSIYGELCDIAGAGDTRTHCVIGDKQLLEILKGEDK